MRTQTEIKLLNLRQALKDRLEVLRSKPVIPLQEYRRVCICFQVCNQALFEYRQNIAA
jgi:hypothetical protein